MDVVVRGLNMKVNDNLEAYAKSKLDKLDRYLPNIAEVRVDLTTQHTKRGEDLAIAQITIRHSRGAILRAEDKSSGDFRKAIDSAVDKMYRRIQRFKGKRKRKGAERFIATVEELSLAEEIPDVAPYDEEIPDGIEALIERRKDIELAAMNEAEAIEQMELLGHNFFMFFNGATGEINVIYKRTTGGYGILAPRTPA